MLRDKNNFFVTEGNKISQISPGTQSKIPCPRAPAPLATLLLTMQTLVQKLTITNVCISRIQGEYRK